MLNRLIAVLSLTTLLLLSSFSLAPCKSVHNDDDDDDEDLSFLEEADDASNSRYPHGHYPDQNQFHDTDDDDSEPDSDAYKEPKVDDKDVVVLKERNFTTVIENNRFVMVEFYAPWCGHCRALAPVYAAAATELKGENVVLAKVDAAEEKELSHEYNVEEFPTIYFFIDGVHKPYIGPRTKNAIVTWIRKKIGPGVYNITTLDHAERILTSESKVVLGFLNSLVGPESDELTAASRLEDNVNFYQTVNPDVAKLFHIDPNVKRPALILLKKEEEKLNYFDGRFVKYAISKFVGSNKLPLVTTFTKESAPSIFESPIKKQLLLFVKQNDSEKFIPLFKEAAKFFKGKLMFIHVEMDGEEVGKAASHYFGVTGKSPKVLAYTGSNNGKKFALNGEVTVDKIKAFGEAFLRNKLKPFFKSDPVPEWNKGDVKVVVGNNFDEIVLDESKDVLLEIYAPWCAHCDALEPAFNKLAEFLRGVESLVLAKMDGTTNEHPRVQIEGFPTFLFFPARNKTHKTINVDTDGTAVALYKFLKKHASIPFKVHKPASSLKFASSDAEWGQSKEVKDEL